jgi:hypothetical protein
LLDKYIAAVTMQVPFAVQSCQFSINLLVPSGWTFALTAADYRGFAYAEVNTTVAHQASYSFEGGTPIRQHRKHAKAERHAFRIHEIRGPFNDNYTIHQELDARTAPWAPCHSENSQTLTVTTALMAKNLIRNSNRQAQISLDSFDGNLQSQKYQLSWKKCRKEQPKPPKNPPQRDQGRDGGRREKPEHGQSDGRRR